MSAKVDVVNWKAPGQDSVKVISASVSMIDTVVAVVLFYIE